MSARAKLLPSENQARGSPSGLRRSVVSATYFGAGGIGGVPLSPFSTLVEIAPRMSESA